MLKKKIATLMIVTMLGMTVISGCGEQGGNNTAGGSQNAVSPSSVAVTEEPDQAGQQNPGTEQTHGEELGGDDISATSGTTQQVVDIPEGDVPLANTTAKVLTPTADGKATKVNAAATIDYSNAAQGYLMVRYTGKNKKIKVQIQKAGGTLYTYNLAANSTYEVFPLTEGNGNYSVKVFENISGTKYSTALAHTVAVKLANQHLPFLYPNQYVNFKAESQVVKTAAEVTKKQKEDIKKVEAVYDYTVSHLTYDKKKAETVKSDYLPDVDAVLKAKKGICFDYASVMAAMLRSQNIPCKLVVGYSGKAYHAWINVYTPQSGWVDGMIYFDGNKWQLMDPTLASSGKKSKEIMKYIGDGKNYTAKYAY